MRFKVYIFVVLMLALLATTPTAIKAQAESAQSREYQIKAAFLYNFIKFVDWPKEKFPDNNKPIIIGIIGKDSFGDAFEPIKNKSVKERNVIIRRFKGLEELKETREKNESEVHPQIDLIRRSHLLFTCHSEKAKLRETINLVKDHSVLTIADTQGFLEAEGIINFVTEGKKVGFEINITAAKQAKLKIRSQLLKLAKKIVKENQSDEAKK